MKTHHFITSLTVLFLLSIAIVTRPVQALTMPDMHVPTLSIPTPSFTHLKLPTPTPTLQTTSPTPTPTKTPTQSITNPSYPSWFTPLTSLFIWITPTPSQSTTSPTPTPTKTSIPTPTSTQPTPTQDGTSSLLDTKQQYLLDAINSYRSRNGLYAVRASKEICDFAKVRAKEITTDFSHNGWQYRVANRLIPFTYSKITENIAMTSDYRNVVNLWINSPSHAANMRADTPYVCVAYSGNYYAYEGMKP